MLFMEEDMFKRKQQFYILVWRHVTDLIESHTAET